MLLDHFDADKERGLEILLEEATGLEFFNSDFDRFTEWIAPYKQLLQQKKIKIVTIAGSNGKGQVAFTLGHYLTVNHKRFSLWSSPHINSVRERFFSDQGFISYSLLLSKIKQLVKRKSSYSPSYYEFLFAIFIEWSLEQDIDYLILEVGLGGRLDAVNVLDSDIAAITSISREHSDILGDRYDQILSEKLAIARPGKQLYTNFSSRYLRDLTARFSTQNNIKWRDIYMGHFSKRVSSYLQRNDLLAVTLAQGLNLDTSIPTSSLGSGRFETIYSGELKLVLVGAHNLDGVRELSKMIDQPYDCALVAFSRRSAKEIEQICKILSKIDSINKVIVTYYTHPKAADRDVVREVVKKLGMTFIDDWKSYLIKNVKGTILIGGSYYFIGQLKREFHL